MGAHHRHGTTQGLPRVHERDAFTPRSTMLRLDAEQRRHELLGVLLDDGWSHPRRALIWG